MAGVFPSEASTAPRPRPPQFSLRSLLAAITLLAVLFAVMSVIGGGWSLVLAWFLILVLGHVLANLHGSRRRPRVAGSPPREPSPGDAHSDAERQAAFALAPPTRLRARTGPGKRMPFACASGALLAGASSAAFFALFVMERAGVAGVLLGIVSAAVLGGFAAFLATSFLANAAAAFDESRRAETRLR